MRTLFSLLLMCALGAIICASATAGLWPVGVKAYLGTTPTLDGVIAPGEYADADKFLGVRHWTHTFSPTTDNKDLSLIGYVKHDGARLYFAFDITDDVLYGIDTERWLPDLNPDAHELSRRGWPWFGDEMEILLNASNHFPPGVQAEGTGSAWQMVCNLTKSRLGGVGVGGLLEGEPRSLEAAWNQYQQWILNRDMEAVAKVKPEGKGYIIEWAINFDPCLEVAPGVFYSMQMGDKKMGLNIALGDLDEKSAGVGNFGNFHHEDWLAGRSNTRTLRREWGSLWMMTGPKPAPCGE